MFNGKVYFYCSEGEKTICKHFIVSKFPTLIYFKEQKQYVFPPENNMNVKSIVQFTRKIDAGNVL